MTRSRSSAPRAFLTAAFIAALFVLLIPTLDATIDRRVGSDPRVSDTRRELTYTNLTAEVLERLSGLETNRITIRVSGENTELMTCETPETASSEAPSRARMHYTRDGSAPTSASPRVALQCADDQQAPSSSKDYFAVLDTAKLTATGYVPGAPVRFMFLITPVGSSTAQPIPKTGEAGYQYLIDKTSPTIISRIPALVSGSSLDTAVTRNERVALNVGIGDDYREAPLDLTSINITIPTAVPPVYTKHFDCFGVTQFNATCTLNYAKLGSTFKFASGDYVMTVKANDTTKNTMAGSKTDLKFRVDVKAPNATNVAAAPNTVATPAPTGGIPTTGRGTLITVTADVEDLSMNTKGLNDVFAQLFNTTRNLQSDFVPMKFVSGNKWEAKNVTVPNTFPEGIYNLSARVVAADQAGNLGANVTGVVTGTAPATKFAGKDAFTVDASPPKIVEKPVPAYIKSAAHTIKINVTDLGAGLDKTKVKILYTNLTGKFVAAPTGTTKVGQYHEASMTNSAGDEYTYSLPAANDSAILVYFIRATDKAGVNGTTDSHTLRVDAMPPRITEVDPRAFRGPPANVFRADVSDVGSGVNDSSVKLLYNFGGSTYRTVTLTRDANSTIFRGAANFTGATDGAKLRYFFEAADVVGNAGNLSSAANPLNSTVDLKPPVSTLTAPPTSSGEKIALAWNATDAGAGVDTFTLHARLKGNEEWVLVLEDTRSRSMDFCAEGNRTYQFRVFAKDRGGNVETPKNTSMGETEIIGAGCKEILTVRVLQPTIGTRVNGQTNSTPILYSAVTTSSATPTRSLKIAILFSPDDGAHYYAMAGSLNNSGVYDLSLKGLPGCNVCLVRVQATSLSGVKGEGTSVPFEILNGNTQTDLDGNGLPDSWELRYGRSLGTFTSGGDDDGDGLINTQESQVGTDPEAKDTDGDGASDRAEVRAGFNPLSAQSVPGREFTRTDEYTNWYWVVPGLFLGTAILFFAGLARRW